MREPIERAWSHAKMILGQHGRRDIKGIPEKEFIDFLSSEPSLRRGRYMEVINRWSQYYRDDSLLVLYFDDIVNRPEEVIDDVLKCIGLNAISENMHTKLHMTVHPGQKMDIPDNIFQVLFRIYQPEMKSMALKLGGVTKEWLASSETRNRSLGNHYRI